MSTETENQGVETQEVDQETEVIEDDLQTGEPTTTEELGQDDDKNPNGIVVGMVVIHFATDRVFQFDANHIAINHAVAHDDVFALPRIDPGIIHSRHFHPFNQHVGALHRVHAIGANVFGVDVVEVNAGYSFDQHAVVGVVTDGEVAHAEVVARGDDTFG